MSKPEWTAIAGITLLALAASVVFFSPRWWILLQPHPGSTYWTRGLEFVRQVEQPFAPSVADVALTWRLAPALLAHGLGLRGFTTFAVPWAGLVVLLGTVAHLTWLQTGDRRLALWFTLLVGTTSAATTVTGWLGMNDAWYAALLLIVARHPRAALALAAVVIGPWCDERFVLALPLAAWLRFADRATPVAARNRFLAVSFAAVCLHCAIRWLDPWDLSAGNSTHFLARVLQEAPQRLPWVSLGWFMGLRSAWVLVVLPLFATGAEVGRRIMIVPASLAAAALGAITLFASDSGRAPTMLLPLLLAGLERQVSQHGLTAARRLLIALFVANCVMPAMHVTLRHADVINVLPVELARLWRS